MRIVILIVLVVFGLSTVACTSEAPSPADTQTASPATPDVPATVEAGISGTREAETAIDATVEATVAETLATSAPTPTPPAGSSASASAGGFHTCEVMGGGSVACWGSDYYGQATPPADSFVSVSAGWDHTCGVRSDGSVACWGWNESGRSTPPAGSFTSVSAGGFHTCGVRSDGSVACWGSDSAGLSTPPAGSFTSVSAGSHHTCGVRSDGSVACWGSDAAGQATPPAGSFVSASAGGNHTCGLRSDGSVVCWGSNFFDGESTPPAGSFVSVSAGNQHTCGLRSDGSVDCWGSDEYGQATPPAGSFVSVSAGNLHTCGVRSDSSVDCWGSDEYGQAAPSESGTRPEPTPTPAPTPQATPPASSFSPTVIADGSDDHGNDIDEATSAAVGVDVEGVIDYERDSDYFSFQAVQGQSYQIDVALGSLDDSIVELYDSDGLFLDSNDDYSGSTASRLLWQASSSGQLYVAVAAYGSGVGTYTLTVTLSTIVDDHGNDIDDATAAAVGVDVEGVIDYEGDSDYFRFTAEEGRLYQIDVTLGTLPDSYLALRDSDDWRLAYNNDNGDSLASRVVWEAPASGDYYLAVEARGWDGLVGSYTLTVSLSTIVDDHGNDIDDATAAAVGVDVEGVIDYEGDSDYFRFTAEEGQLYQIDVTLGTLPDSYLALRDSDDWRLAYNNDNGDSLASRVVWEAPASGDYYLAVEARGRDGLVGSYTLTVTLSTIVDDHGNDIDDATSTAVGVDVEGVIDYEGDSDYFRFTAEEGQLYQIDVTLGTLPDSYLALRDSDDWRLAYNNDNGDSLASRVVWEAPASGDYYLAVEARGRDGLVGSYTLTVTLSTIVDDHGNDIDDATSTAVGVDVEGVIDYEGDSDYFRFTAEEGQLYQIDVTLGTLPDSYLALRDSDDWRLASNDDHGDSLASRIFWEAPASGDYYLAVEARGWDGLVGSYTLTVTRR